MSYLRCWDVFGERKRYVWINGLHVCDPGYYSSAGSSECIKCPAGHYTDGISCTAADVGYYVGETNEFTPNKSQYKCPIGSFTDLPGQKHCIPCPPNTSTYATASTSLDDCIKCPHGVDANTLACIDAASNPLDNVCWDPSQLLGLSPLAVEDLNNLVYELPDVGINALIGQAMNVIQGAAAGTSTIDDIQTVLDKLKNAPENWLRGLSQNYGSCVAATSQAIYLNADSTQYHQTNLFEFQLGNSRSEYRAEWIAQWQCKGARFGCTTLDTTGCPQAETCFAPLYQFFGPILSYGGGSTFGNFQELITGRYTPLYSPDFISKHLEDNVNSLVQWTNSATSFKRYYNVIQQIESSTAEIKSFTADLSNVFLQVNNVSTSVNLESSYTLGNLYYEQAQYNYNQTLDISEILQWGPAWCPSGYEINATGIPYGDGCIDYDTLVEQCQREIKFNAYVQIMKDTMAISAGIVAPQPGTLGKINKVVGVSGKIVERNRHLYFNPVVPIGGGILWNPDTEMPDPPPLDDNGFFENKPYADAAYQWYLDSQKDVSESLVSMSPAKWNDIKRKNYDQYGQNVLNPPNCPNHQRKIKDATIDYLLTVNKFTDYGSAMTEALMSLVPAMGNIAAAIATQTAISDANEEINGMVNQPNPSIVDTAPSEYEESYKQIYFSTDPDTPDDKVMISPKAKAILAYGPSATLVQRQYLAAKQIFGFCASYRYMNAGGDYENTSNGKTANCREFSLYVPTYGTFKQTVDWFVSGDNTAITNPPSMVDELNKNIVGFAGNVQGNPIALGQTRGEVGDDVFTLTLEFSNDPNSATSPFHGDLADGNIRFTLTPSSQLLWKNTLPGNAFAVFDANPRIINIQTYWRGVTSPHTTVTTHVNPIGPAMVYGPSGEGTTYNLPPYTRSSDSDIVSPTDSDIFFAEYISIQRQECMSSTEVTRTWRDGEHLKFCTPYLGDPNQPINGIEDSAFLFPSMWDTWEVKADEWNSYYDVNETELALQVVFRYIESSKQSPREPRHCAMNCEVGMSTSGNVPLIGEEWCDKNSCSDCIVSHSFNGTQFITDPFCRCNVWNGDHETCDPSTATTDIFSVEYSNSSATSASRRNLNVRRRLKKKEGRAYNSGSKTGKNEKLSPVQVPLGLEEMLEKYLEDCDVKTNANDIFRRSDTKVEIECMADEIETMRRCEFDLSIPTYNDETYTVTMKAANDCAITKLRDQEAIDLTAELVDSDPCDVKIYHHGGDKKKEIIAQWEDHCDLLFG